MTHMDRFWRTSSASLAALALVAAGSAQRVAAQPADPDACSAIIEMAWLESDAVDKDAPPTQAFTDLAMQQPLVRLYCAPAGEPPPNPARIDPPATLPQAPAAGAPADDGPDARVDTDRSACLLVTVSEVGAAMRQSVTETPADPFGAPGAQGCEFTSAGQAFTSVIYFQANGAVVYDSFQTTAQANGVQAVSGLGDRAFSFVGNAGPGVVVAKGDKLFALEFSGIGSGPAEGSSLLQLAHLAVGRVH